MEKENIDINSVNIETKDEPTISRENHQSQNKTNCTYDKNELGKENEKEKRVINIIEELIVMKRDKDEGDKQMQIDLKKAILIYNKLIELIMEIKDTNPEPSILSIIADYEKRINSNLALANFKFKNYEKAIDYDLYIISKLDKNFDKSYARLIKCYVYTHDFNEALEYFSKMHLYFNSQTLDKYSDVFMLFEDKCKEYPKIMKEIEKIKNLKRKWSSKTWLMIFGVILLIFLLLYSFIYRNSVINESSKSLNLENNDILSTKTD